MASLIENMAPEYTTDGAKAGNYYMHSKLLYLCKSDCSGLFDESNFEQVYLSDLLRGTANSNLGGLSYSKCKCIFFGIVETGSTVNMTLTLPSDISSDCLLVTAEASRGAYTGESITMQKGTATRIKSQWFTPADLSNDVYGLFSLYELKDVSGGQTITRTVNHSENAGSGHNSITVFYN